MRDSARVEVQVLCEKAEVDVVRRIVKFGGERDGEGCSMSIGPRMRKRLWRNLTRERHLVKSLLSAGRCDLGESDDANTGALFHGMMFDVDVLAVAGWAVGEYHCKKSIVVDVESDGFDVFVRKK